MSKSVLTREEADGVAVAYTPPKFPHVVSKAASDFVAMQDAQGQGMSFRMERIVAQQTGVAELERLSIEEKVEQEALLRLKAVQEDAYREAYQLGLEEGRDSAFHEKSAEFVAQLQRLQGILSTIERMKTDLVAFNEAHIVSLIFYMTKRIVHGEISARPEIILEVVRQAIEAAQSDESVVVRVSPKDFAFIEGIRDKIGKDFDALKRARLEKSDDILDGGCVVETNYGEVSATIDQRLEKLWATVSEKLPHVKDVISHSSDPDGDGGSANGG